VLHPSYKSVMRENRDVSGNRDVHPAHRKTARSLALDRLAGNQKESRLRIGTYIGTLREEESQLRRQDEARRRDLPDDYRETVNDLIFVTDRRSSLRRRNRLLDHLSLDLIGANRRADRCGPSKGQACERGKCT